MTGVTVTVDYDKVIAKLTKGEKLTEVEQAYVNKKLEQQKKTEDAAKRYQAILNLKLAYAVKNGYVPTEDEIKKEIERIRK